MKCLIKCLADDYLDILACRGNLHTITMRLFDGFLEILKIQKFRRIVSYAGFYCFVAVVNYAYTSNTWVLYDFKLQDNAEHVLVLLLMLVMAFSFGALFCCCRTRAGYSRADQYYASYPAGTELLTDTAKVCEKFDSEVSN